MVLSHLPVEFYFLAHLHIGREVPLQIGLDVTLDLFRGVHTPEEYKVDIASG